MTRLLVSLMIFASLAGYAADTRTVLSEGLKLASQEELKDPKLIGQLQEIARESKVPQHRISAIYLLTFVEWELAEQEYRYVDMLMANPQSAAILGPKAMERLGRLNAEHSFERGQFDKAIAHYQRLRETAEGEYLDYVTLKLGWSYMNKEQANKAFALWTETVDKSLKQKKEMSPNLLRGLGQALTEKLDRNEADLASLNRLVLSKEQQRAVAEGIVEGKFFLKKSHQWNQWATQIRTLKIYPTIAEVWFEDGEYRKKNACRSAVLISGMDSKKLSFDSYGADFTECVKKIEKGKVDKNTVALVTPVIDSMELNSAQRDVRYTLHLHNSRWTNACLEGLRWSAEESREEKEANIRATDIVRACQKAIESNPAEGTKAVLATLEELNSETPLYTKVDSPMMYLVTALAKRKNFATQMATQVLNNPKHYADSLLPPLLTEKLMAHSEDAFAYQFTNVFKDSGNTKVAEIRTVLTAKHIGKLVQSKQYDAAQTAISQSWPLESLASASKTQVRILVTLTAKAFAESQRPSWVEQNVKFLLENPSLIANKPKYLKSALEMGLEFEMWQPVWITLSKVANEKKATKNYMSQKLELALFEAVASGKLDPKGWEELPKGLLRGMVSVAVATGNSSDAKFGGLKLARASVLRKDLACVQSLERRRAKALREKKGVFAGFSGWVSFMNHVSKRYRKHKWTSPLLYSRSLEMVGSFCEEVSGKLAKVSYTGTEVSPEQWQQLVTSFGANLTECMKWVKDVQQENQKGAQG